MENYPVLLQIGPIAIHWYGVMYLLGFAMAWGLGVWRARRPGSGWTQEQVGDVIFYGAVGVILGGRVGYILFYDLPAFVQNPLFLFKVWQGGMSFHGGLLGVAIALVLFARAHDKRFFDLCDFIAPLVPLGLGAGRIGNFINGELWGRVTSVPWGMVFPLAGPEPRHPSQLYEFFLEGLVLFAILWCYSHKPKPTRAVSGLFLVVYAVFRCFVELFRQPDPQYGYLAFGWLTMGQLLSLPMLMLGIWLMISAYQSTNKSAITKEVR